MKFDLADLFTFAGLALLAAGIGVQFTPAYAAIMVGGLLFALGVWKA